MFKVRLQHLQGTLTTAFEKHFAVEDFTEMDQHTYQFFLGKYEMKMGEGVRKTIICTKVRAPFVKNISLITVFFFFSQTDLVFNFNLILIE